MKTTKVYLFEYVYEGYNSETTISYRGDYNSKEEALERFNKDLKGGFLCAPSLGNFPKAFIIEGNRIDIKIKKTGIYDITIKEDKKDGKD